MQKIGIITQNIINLLNLHIEAGTPIYVGEQNIKHMKNRHPIEFEKYFYRISEIIEYPDYVGLNGRNNSIDYVKMYEINGEYIQVSVRINATGIHYARTLFQLLTFKVERFIEQGTLIKVP